MSPRQRFAALLVPLVAGLGACGSAADPPPPFTSGVDEAATLGTLTPTQRTTLCTTQAAYVRTRVDTTALTRFWCAFTPGVLAAAEGQCDAAMDACVRTFSVQLDITVTDPNAPLPQCYQADTSTCRGTVKQYEDCVSSLAAVQVRVGTDWSCGKRASYSSSPTVGVTACDVLGPTCSAVTGTPSVR
jgi:hypothetical protein